MTVDGLARKERYQVWFVVEMPSDGYTAEVVDLADAFVVLNALANHVLSIPDHIIPHSAGGVNYWDGEEYGWLTWIAPSGEEWDEFERDVFTAMEEDDVPEVQQSHYPTVKKYMDKVLVDYEQ